MAEAIEGAGAWTVENLKGFLQGINLSEDEDLIEPGELVNAENVFYKKEQLKSDSGYRKFRGLVRGTPQGSFQLFKKDGSSVLLLVTTLTLYRDLNSQWQYISNGTSTTLTAQANAGATALTVTSITGFAANEHIGVTLDNGTQHQTQVSGTPSGSTINITTAIPVGRNAPNGAAVVEAVVLAGTLDKQVSFAPLPSNDWLAFTNGVDIVKRFDGTDCVNIPGLPSSGNTVARAIVNFNNALWLLHTIEGGTALPQRVRRSAIGNPTDWSEAAGATSGFNDLYETEDFILSGNPLGPYLIIYRERSIVRCEFVGSADKMYSFTTMITGEGSVSTHSVVDMGDYHILFGNSNVYEYRAGFDLKPIGDKIYFRVYGVDGDLNILNKGRVFTLFVEELNEVWMFRPSASSDEPDVLLRYEVAGERFTERKFAHKFNGFGYFIRDDSPTWLELVGNWVDQTWNWNSVSIQAGSPTTLLCGVSPLQVYEYEYTMPDDDGTVISYKVETKDFTNVDYLTRFNSISFTMQGTSVILEYSTDEGGSWNSLGTLTSAGVVPAFIRVYKQFVAKRFRFRWRGSGAFILGWLSMETALESLN